MAKDDLEIPDDGSTEETSEWVPVDSTVSIPEEDDPTLAPDYVPPGVVSPEPEPEPTVEPAESDGASETPASVSPEEPPVPTEEAPPSADATPTSPASEPASGTASETSTDTSPAPSVEPPTATPEIVPTAINPQTWPDPNKGTVTDPEVLRQNGIVPPTEPVPTPAAPPAVETAPVDAGAIAEPEGEGETFQCLKAQLPSGCPLFKSANALSDPPGQVLCPNCGSKTVVRV